MGWISEQFWRDVVTGRRTGWVADLLRLAFLPISWVYRLGVSCRNFVYQSGWMKRYHPPVDVVVSVGNIAVGGTGKTPFTLLLAKQFYQECPIGILYRGYRAKAEHLSTPLTLSRGKGPMFPAGYCGDEPYLIARHLPETHIFVGRDRTMASRFAAECGAKLVIMDDGLQHRRVMRDFDVILIDREDPFGQGHFLPRGLLREGTRALERASLLVVHPIGETEDFIRIRDDLAPLSPAPVIGTQLRVVAIRNLQGDDIGSLEGKKVGLFCGIAQPERFKQTLQECGAVITTEFLVSDHGECRINELMTLAETTIEQGGEALVCTEKDQVKLPESLELPLPIYWVEVGMEVVEGREVWEEFIRAIRQRIR